MRIYFVTTNKRKIEETKQRLERFLERIQTQERVPLEICPLEKQLDELLDCDIERIVRKKALDAYRFVRLPCVVEHGGLFLDAWRRKETPGLLGGLGQIVWDAVGERVCGFLRAEDSRTAEAQSVVGYCDGRRVHVYSGITKGEVTEKAYGDRGFRWDPIFKPTGCDLTYGQMSPEEKRETSPEEKAWELFFQSIKAEFVKACKM